VAGGGVTVDPLTVMVMLRPAGLELDDDDEEDDDDDDEGLEDEVLVLPVEPSPEVPQALSTSATASPAAYVTATRGVIFVTNASLDSAF
jgi:hypothetical protein